MHLLRISAILVLLLAGCGRATPVIPSATPTAAITATQTAASTTTPAPTRRPSETPTDAPNCCATPTSVFSVVNHSLSPIADLRGFSGEWSPTANQMAGIIWEDEETGYFNIITAPDFEQNRILQERVFFGEAIFGHDLAWSPDGNAILFDGPAEFGPVRDLSTPWVVSSNGQVTKQILKNPEPERWVQFPGWLDDQTMILGSYIGGDTHTIRLVDFESGEILAQENIPGEVFPGRPSGAPFEYHVSPAKIGVITKTQQGERQGRVSHVRMMPESERMLPPQNRMMDVLGWQPGTDTLLVSVETLASSASSLEAAQVVAWNIMTDEVSQLAPKAGYAEYSPNGRWLALMAYNDLPINPDLRIDQSASPDVWKGFMGPQLYLVDQVDGKVKLHVPVGFSYRCCNDSSPSRTPWAAFSPDGRHMAFITYGAAQVNQAVPPEKEPPIPELKFILNVLDLETLQITLNGPCPVSSRFEPTFLWSPDGENLFYDVGHTFGGSGPGVLNVISGEWIDININPNLNVEPAAWSHDGTYLSLQASLPPSYLASDTHTLIYKIK